MNHIILFDLEKNRKRLDYYSQLKGEIAAKPATPAPASIKVRKPSSISKAPQLSAIDKWIEIYSDRVKKLERQATKLGLKNQLLS